MELATIVQTLSCCDFRRLFNQGQSAIMREETSASAVRWVMAAGIRTSTTTDWLPNAGIAPSSDRTAPGRTSRFSAPDRSPAGNAWCLDRRGRVERARLLVTGDNNRRVQRRQPI